jgi:hypothetical protein
MGGDLLTLQGVGLIRSFVRSEGPGASGMAVELEPSALAGMRGGRATAADAGDFLGRMTQ